MEEYDLGKLKDTKNRALGYYKSGMVGRALREFELLGELADAAKSPKALKYKQQADQHIATCNADIKKLDELGAAKKSRPRRKIYAEPDISNL